VRRTIVSVSASPVTRVASNLYFAVMASLLAIGCDCALRSFEVTELLLLVGAENLVEFGLHAGVRDDQPCQQTCFLIGQSFDLLLIYVFTPDCKREWSKSFLRAYELTYQSRNFIRCRIQREMTTIYNVDFSIGDISAVGFRFRGVKR
jgi:hypothetical protein